VVKLAVDAEYVYFVDWNDSGLVPAKSARAAISPPSARYVGSMFGRLEAAPGLVLILGLVVVALGALGTPDPFVIVLGIAGALFGVYDIWRSRRE
jgi:hypothetical protein